MWVQEAPAVARQIVCVECGYISGKDRPVWLSRPRTWAPNGNRAALETGWVWDQDLSLAFSCHGPVSLPLRALVSSSGK